MCLCYLSVIVCFHLHFSSPSVVLITRIFASSGAPLSFIKTLQFDVHVFCIFFCFLKSRAIFAISALCLVRCSFTKTLVPLSSSSYYMNGDTASTCLIVCSHKVSLFILEVMRDTNEGYGLL